MNVLRDYSWEELIAKRDTMAREFSMGMNQEQRSTWAAEYYAVQQEMNRRMHKPRLAEVIEYTPPKVSRFDWGWMLAVVAVAALLIAILIRSL